jgi:hypothetical protein
MNIVNAQYVEDGFGNAIMIRAEFENGIMFAPIDSDNNEYIEIMRQVEAGELVIQEADSGSE